MTIDKENITLTAFEKECGITAEDKAEELKAVEDIKERDKFMQLKDKTIAYLVEYSKCNSVFSEYGDTSKEYWSKETLAKRLLDFHYSVHSAVMVIIDEDTEIVTES